MAETLPPPRAMAANATDENPTKPATGDTPSKPARYKTGILVDLGAVADSWPGRAVKSAGATGASWLESLLSSVEAWRASATMLVPYVIEDVVLGEGGYGRVVRGRDTTSGEVVAIKELLVPAGSERRHSDVVKEVAILRRLSDGGKAHPHIVGFRGYFERVDKHYVVMEACMGGELFDKVTGGEVLSEDDGRVLFAQLVAGLQHCHACGVAHRDLKLENVLLTVSGRLKIADFGLAHLHRATTHGSGGATSGSATSGAPGTAGGGFEVELLTEYCGSKSYCPPEMLARLPYAGFAADLWSLGVCLFALLAGFFPFEEASTRDWRFVKAEKAQRDRTSVTVAIFGFYGRTCPFSSDLVALLDGLLTVDPDHRLTLHAVAASPWLVPPPPDLAGLHARSAPAAPAAEGLGPVSRSSSLESSGTSQESRGISHESRSISQGPELDLGSLEIAHKSGGQPGGQPGGGGAGPPALARQRAGSRYSQVVGPA